MKPANDTQNLATQITVHRLCCDFEKQWQIGERPTIESYLTRVDHVAREHLLLSLLESELEIRIDRGEHPTRDEYRDRFADSDAAVDRAFDETRPAYESSGQVAENKFHIAHYSIVNEIDRGGMGVVYRAVDQRLGRTVALKVILSGHLASQPEIQRFEIEARTVAMLDHPGIVPIFEVGKWAGHRYLTMPLIEGHNLAHTIDQKPSPVQAAEVMRQIAVAIQFAHAAGIIHRDLKPRNILLDDSGRIRVTDFGLAKVVQPTTPQNQDEPMPPQITATGQVMGTLSYMSPEQAAGEETGPTTDIYSLGAVLYELLTGQPPFQANSVLDLLQQIQNWMPISPRKVNPETPRDLATICLKCLEKDPRQRYATAGDFQEDLVRFLHGRPVLARPVGPVGRLQRWSHRNPAIASLLASITLLVCAALVALTLMNVKIRHETREKSYALQQESLAKRNAEQAETAATSALKAETAALKRARDALDTLTDNVVETLLVGKPKLDDNEKTFLKKVAELYAPFSKSQSNRASADIRRSAANALFRLGSIHQILGDLAEAEKSMRQAEQLLMDVPLESIHGRTQLAEVRTKLASMMNNSGNKVAAIAVMRREVEDVEAIVARFPDDVEVRLNYAVLCLNLVIVLHPPPEHFGECEILTRKAQPHLEAEAKTPNCPDKVLLYLSSCYNNLGAFAAKRDDYINAESNFKLALSVRERLAARDPNDVETQVYVANTLSNLAQLQLRRHDRDEADATYTRAIAVRENVVRQVPGNPYHRQALASTLTLHGEMLMDDDPEKAIAKFDRALAVLSVEPPPGALAAIANNMAIGVQTRRATALDRLQRTAEAEAAWEQVCQSAPPGMQAEVRLARALSLAKLGNYRRAIEVAEQVTEQPNLTEDDRYNCACVVALASVVAAIEPEVENRSAARAVELLRRINDGYFNAVRLDHMKHDPDLDSLRQRTDYQEWLVELEDGLNNSNLGDSALDDGDCPK